MCGIFGFVDTNPQSGKVILDGLKALEYRGYDSAGLVLIDRQNVAYMRKCRGGVADLELKVEPGARGVVGLGHTRWATHGAPSDLNAHPHRDCSGNIWLIHNGIIENYAALKAAILKKGHVIESETDTEVLAHLIEDLYSQQKTKSLLKAVQAALVKATGAYALVAVAASDPTRLVAARLSSPLIIGVGKKAMFLASDAAALVPHTKKVVYLNDGEVAEITAGAYKISNLNKAAVKRAPVVIDWNIKEAEKGGWPHFFIKEIFEQPEALRNSLRGRLLARSGRVKLGGLESVAQALGQARHLTFLGCGSAAVAGLVGKYLVEDLAELKADFEIASEYRYRNPVISRGEVVMAISQSGETADTLAALRLAESRGALTLGLVNAVGSTMARETEAGVYNHIGPEISVASTKAFTSQLTILTMIALLLAEQRGVNASRRRLIVKELERLPKLAKEALRVAPQIERLARKYADLKNALFLGRRYSYPVAVEGAIKLKEVTYIHAEGMPAGEPKHHSIALVDERLLSVFVAPQDSVYEKTLSSMQEIKARRGPILALTTKGNRALEKIADDVIYLPKIYEAISPIIYAIPLQLFAYYVGVARGVNLDRPRNLAKSVTVE